MKLTFAFAYLLVGIVGANCAQVSLSQQTAAPGDSVPVPLSFLAQGGQVSGIQFDLTYDTTAISLGYTIGDAASNAGKNLYVAPGNTRFMIVGLNRTVIADGTIVNLFVNVSPLAASGDYPIKFSNVVATDPDGIAVQLAGVDGTVTVQGTTGTRLQLKGVLNAASLRPGPVAPGEIVSLIGSAIGAAPGTFSVLFGGTPATLLYTAPNFINVAVPYEIAGLSTTELDITYQNQPKISVSVPVGGSAPGIFTLAGNGAGSAAAINQDGTVNTPSNPAAKGSIISLYATGAGQTEPPGVDGAVPAGTMPTPVLPVSVQIGGLEAAVRYAGASPGMLGGLLQVNCTVPANVASGLTVPVVLTIGQAHSQAGVTVAIR